MQALTVRLATSADAVALASLTTETFTQTWHDLVPAEDGAGYCATVFSPEALHNDLDRPSVCYLVFAGSEGLAGYVRLSWGLAPPAPLEIPYPALLDRFYLQSTWHGTGAAQTLLRAVYEQARDYGIETLWLCHHPSNERAGLQ
ncbi:GNAT family N-acetyltransferase [Armatimonas sp.]|uniref:GNAT family N-acetyltransferase n=1 Tax=Armatimonas sp. TaxID=1872638 RepID=UPI0037539325